LLPWRTKTANRDSDSARRAPCGPTPRSSLENPEKAGNEILCRITEKSLRLAKEIPFETLIDLLEKLAPLAYEYGKRITGKNNLRLVS